MAKVQILQKRLVSFLFTINLILTNFFSSVQIIDEKREDRKRQKADDAENDLDRGRSKKLKSHKIDYGRDNPEFNPFQEHQTQQQNKRHFSHNGNNNKHYTGHIYRQSAHFKHFRGGRHRGNGFQNSNRQGHRNHFQYKNS